MLPCPVNFRFQPARRLLGGLARHSRFPCRGGSPSPSFSVCSAISVVKSLSLVVLPLCSRCFPTGNALYLFSLQAVTGLNPSQRGGVHPPLHPFFEVYHARNNTYLHLFSGLASLQSLHPRGSSLSAPCLGRQFRPLLPSCRSPHTQEGSRRPFR